MKRIYLITSILLFVSVISWAIKMKLAPAGDKAPALVATPGAGKMTRADSVLLRKLEQITALLDVSSKPCTYEGKVTIINGTDTARSIKDVPILFAKNHNDCYYRYGTTELLNDATASIYIEHGQKKIWVSAPKTVQSNPVDAFSGLREKFLSENYRLFSKVKGSQITITLLNEKHVSCKEYAVTYDTLARQVKRIYTRLTDLHSPLDKTSDKQMAIEFASWQNEADVSRYLKLSDILVRANGRVQLSNKYKRYELIGSR